MNEGSWSLVGLALALALVNLPTLGYAALRSAGSLFRVLYTPTRTDPNTPASVTNEDLETKASQKTEYLVIRLNKVIEAVYQGKKVENGRLIRLDRMLKLP